MTAASTDRRYGISASVAVKAPVKAATTAAITLSGAQTIDGVSVVAGDRVLVKDQTDQTTNGLYTADTGTWTRTGDADGSYDFVNGTMVYVTSGTANGNKFFQQTTADTVTVGSSNLVFSAVSVAFSGLTANSVATSNIQASAVTYAKIQNVAANSMLGNNTSSAAAVTEIAIAAQQLLGRGSTGNIAAITLGTGLSMSGTTLSAPASATTPASSFRLTLTTATAVTTSDVTAATTVYLTPYKGNGIQVYSGTAFVAYTASELSLALDSNAAHTGYHQSGKNFDLFAYISSGAVAIGTGPAWSSDTARGTGAGTTELQLVTGVYTNKYAITLRIGTASGDTVSVSANQATYLGSFRCTADGQTEDSNAKRFVWNNYNRAARLMSVIESTDSWTYTTAAYRQANGSTANQLDFIVGVSEDAVQAKVRATVLNAGGVNVYIGIGLDSTTAISSSQMNGEHTTFATGGSQTNTGAEYVGYPGAGRHYLTWLEYSQASGTTTWYGDNGAALLQSGMKGVMLG